MGLVGCAKGSIAASHHLVVDALQEALVALEHAVVGMLNSTRVTDLVTRERRSEKEEEKEGWEHPLMVTHLSRAIPILEGIIVCLQPEGYSRVLTAIDGHAAAPVLQPHPSQKVDVIVLWDL